MNKITLIVLVVVITIAIGGLCILLMRSSEPELNTEVTKASTEFNAEVTKASAEFKATRHFRYEPAKKLVPHLKIGMTTHEVEALLGKPDMKSEDGLSWHYTLGFSQLLGVVFDSNGIAQKFGGSYAGLLSQEVK